MPLANERKRTRRWYEENSPGQRVRANVNVLPTEQSLISVLEVRDFGEPAAVTIQLDRSIIRAVQPYNARVIAHVQYGIGGASDSFKCDWADGGMLTIVAQRLTVTARGERAVSGVPYDMTGLELDLVAGIGKGQPSVIMPTYTQQLDSIAPAGLSAPITPPPFAKAVSVLAFSLTTDPYPNLEVLTISPVGGVYSRVLGEYLGGGAAMPLPAECLVRVQNTGLVNLVPTLIWQLGL